MSKDYTSMIPQHIRVDLTIKKWTKLKQGPINKSDKSKDEHIVTFTRDSENVWVMTKLGELDLMDGELNAITKSEK
jgi:hypothetical protein